MFNKIQNVKLYSIRDKQQKLLDKMIAELGLVSALSMIQSNHDYLNGSEIDREHIAIFSHKRLKLQHIWGFQPTKWLISNL